MNLELDDTEQPASRRPPSAKKLALMSQTRLML